MSDVSRAVALAAGLRGIERDADGLVELDPGIPDGEMDGWPVPVPEEVRALFREVGGIRLPTWEDFTFGRHCAGSCTYCWRAGEAGTFWFLHHNGAAEVYYADVDPETGRWGPVFSFWEDPSAACAAPDLLTWLEWVAEGLRLALSAHPGRPFEDTFAEWFFDEPEDAEDGNSPVPEREHATVPPVPVEEARESADPALARIAAGLPDDSFLADLRGSALPAEVPFDRDWTGYGAIYRRFLGGTVLAAVPDD